MKVKSETAVSQLCQTSSDPMDCSLPGSSAHGIFQARVLEWGAIARKAKKEFTIFMPREGKSLNYGDGRKIVNESTDIRKGNPHGVI